MGCSDINCVGLNVAAGDIITAGAITANPKLSLCGQPGMPKIGSTTKLRIFLIDGNNFPSLAAPSPPNNPNRFFVDAFSSTGGSGSEDRGRYHGITFRLEGRSYYVLWG